MNLVRKYQDLLSGKSVDPYFRNCGLSVCENPDLVDGKVLILGMNPKPAGDDSKDIVEIYTSPILKKDNPYFKKLCRYVPEQDCADVGYLDLFPFYAYPQRNLLSKLKREEEFIASIIRVTQGEIERINPALLILANKALYPFVGVFPQSVWMGYDFDKVFETELPTSMQSGCFDVRIIKGLRQDTLAKEQIIYKPFSGETNLRRTVVLFYKHNRGLKVDERLNMEMYSDLKNYAMKVKYGL